MGENFRRKARFVANWNETEAPATLTYSSVVSQESVRIALTIASLNQLEILACDIQNAYLTADCWEIIYVIAGPEFVSEEGKVMIVRKALYGLKTSGVASEHTWLRPCMIWGTNHRVQILMFEFDQRLILTGSSTKRWCLYMSMIYSVFHMIQRQQ